MKVICRDRQKSTAPEGRALSSVAADINRLLSPKSYEQLQALEVQVRKKLDSNEPIDTDYWEELLRSLTVWKARAKVKKVFQAVIDERVRGLRDQQREEAESVRARLAPLAPTIKSTSNAPDEREFRGLDPDPLLQIRPEDKGLEIVDEDAFLSQVVSSSHIGVIPSFCLLTELVGSRSSEGTEDGLRSPAPATSGETISHAGGPDVQHVGFYRPHALFRHTQRRFLTGYQGPVRARTRQGSQ